MGASHRAAAHPGLRKPPPLHPRLTRFPQSSDIVFLFTSMLGAVLLFQHIKLTTWYL